MFYEMVEPYKFMELSFGGADTVRVYPKGTISLDQTGLKWIAVLFMTVDHIAVYLQNVDFIVNHYTILRILGRIAAPIFLYCFVETMHHTKSRKAVLLRLYGANLCCNLITIVCNLTAPDVFGFRWVSNIMPTFLYTAIAILLLDRFFQAIQVKEWKTCGFMVLICAILLLFYLTGPTLYDFVSSRFSTDAESRQTVSGLLRTLLPSPYYVDYSWLFILLGVLWYYFRDKKKQMGIFLVFCIASFLGERSGFSPTNFSDFFSDNQYWMLLALPILCLYNGRRGKGHKNFFYVYYPLHILVILGINFLVGQYA